MAHLVARRLAAHLTKLVLRIEHTGQHTDETWKEKRVSAIRNHREPPSWFRKRNAQDAPVVPRE
jgi:hypothetical protein